MPGSKHKHVAGDVIGFEEIKAELQLRIRHLVKELLADGYFSGSYYMARNPLRADKRAGSLWVKIAGSGIGAWRDEADQSMKGDVINLVATFAGLPDMRQTRLWCMSFLGWGGGMARDQLDAKRKAAQYVAEQEERLAKQTLAEARSHAFGLFINAKPIIDTPVEYYLASRGIDLSVFARPPGCLRFLPNARHRDEEGGESFWPCMLAAMNDERGRIAAVHRTWLAQEGKGKAPVTPNKKIWPSFKGCVIRINRGETGLNPEEAARRGRRGPLVAVEGIEDALTLAMAAPEYRIWAAGTLGNLANIPKLPCISDLILYRDRDASSEAQRTFHKVCHHLIDRGFRLSVAQPLMKRHKDANEFWMEGESEKA
jgi:hypothetical protein